MAVIRQFSTGIPADLAPIDLIEAHLNGDAARDLDGIQPALDDDDLLSAVIRHETLNEFLLLTSGDLPEGSVDVVLAAIAPATPTTAGTAFVITFHITSDLSSPATAEDFDLESVVSDVRWAVSLDAAQVTLVPGETAQVEMTVTPDATLAIGEFANINLVARAARRPSIVSTNVAQRFTIGENPPGETFFFYSGAIAPVGGVLQIPRGDIEESIVEIEFTLINSSGGVETHTFQLDFELVFPATVPAGLDPTQWIPNAPVTLANQDVTGTEATAIVALRAPDLSAVAVDITATLEITAVLTDINGTPISGGKSASIALPLLVDMT